MREVTLNTPQGVGDIFWIYQKHSPYFDKINFNVLALQKDAIQQRSEPFVKLFPKVGRVDFKYVSNDVYTNICGGFYSLSSILKAGITSYNYSANAPLEWGVRLEDIDKDLEIEWGVKLPYEEHIPIKEKYTCLYVSGSKPDFTWTAHAWADFVNKIYIQHNLPSSRPIVLLGAQYDMPVLKEIGIYLTQQGRKIYSVYAQRPERVLGVIKRAELFIGYQSGLSILADNFDVKQVMIYFPFLKSMKNTWCKPQNLTSGLFQAYTFDQPMDEIVKNIKL